MLTLEVSLSALSSKASHARTVGRWRIIVTGLERTQMDFVARSCLRHAGTLT
jgi:hypothetical protein